MPDEGVKSFPRRHKFMLTHDLQSEINKSPCETVSDTTNSSLASLPKRKDFRENIRVYKNILDTGAHVLHVMAKDDAAAGKFADYIQSEVYADIGRDEMCRTVCKSIHVGSLVVTNQYKEPLQLTLAPLWIQFTIPYSSSRSTYGTIFIPIKSVTLIKAHLHKNLCVIFLKTTEAFSQSIRVFLRMDEKLKDSSGVYYCPINGTNCHNSIIFVVESVSDEYAWLLRRLHFSRLREISFTAATRALIAKSPPQITYRAESNWNPVEVTLPSAIDITSTNSMTQATASYVYDHLYDKSSQVDGSCSQCQVCLIDLKHLPSFTYSNETIIDFWMKRILNNFDGKDDVFCFPSSFYTKLTEQTGVRSKGYITLDNAVISHAGVRYATEFIDIFERKFLIVPARRKSQWLCAIIFFPGMTESHNDYKTSDLRCETVHSNERVPGQTGFKRPCIILFYSKRRESRMNVISNLRMYLKVEYKDKRGEDMVFDNISMPGVMPVVPQQNDDSNDCAMFCCITLKL